MPEYPVLENEAALVEQAKTDDGAFSILYEFYFPKIYAYIFRRTGNQQATEDLVSITFLKAFENLNKYTHNSFKAWLYRIATNNLIDHYRKNAKHPVTDLENVQDIADSRLLPTETIQINQDNELVRQVLSKLPAKYQQVLYLKFFAEQETHEIAQALKISANNTRVLISRALKKFNIIYTNLS